MTSIQQEKLNRNAFYMIASWCRDIWRNGSDILPLLESQTKTELQRAFVHAKLGTLKSAIRQSQRKLVNTFADYLPRYFESHPKVRFERAYPNRHLSSVWNQAILTTDVRYWLFFPELRWLDGGEPIFVRWVLKHSSWKDQGKHTLHHLSFPQTQVEVNAWREGTMPGYVFADWLEEREEQWPQCPPEFLLDLRTPLSCPD